MFGALRQCPANLSRRLPLGLAIPRVLRTSFSHSNYLARTPSTTATKTLVSQFHHSSRWQQTAAAEVESDAFTEQEGPVTEFQELATRNLVHPNIINTITKKMKLTSMTDVQTRTINEALSGVDIIAQAKTGTGKTLGFLVPIIQRIIQDEPKLGEKARGYKRARPDDIKAIVISPTRELAEQIAVEAQKVTSGTSIVVQVAVGGTQKRMMLQKTQREGCHLLIATPGRLLDILSDPYSGIKAPNLSALVMDEADRLLDDGFQKEIEEVARYLPDPKEVERQNLMFSATIPRDVVDLVRRTLRPGFHFAKCVSEDDVPTHERVPQKYVELAGFENIMPALYELVLQQKQAAQAGTARPFKAIVYFNSTAEVTLAASVMYKLSGGFKRDTPLSGLQAFEIHSKLSQAQRTQAAAKFRNCQSGMLFSSDVTARGMDFPNVTHVIQIGIARDRDSYIHRLGRTGRAGKEGEGWIFLSPFETREVHKRFRGLPLTNATKELECATVDMTQPGEIPENVSKILTDCSNAFTKVYPDQLDGAFRGIFGSYQWYADKQGLIDGAHRLAEFGWGLDTPPQIPSSLFGHGGRGRGNMSRGRFGGDRQRESNDPFGDALDREERFSQRREGGGRSFGGDRGRDRGSRDAPWERRGGQGGRDRDFGGDRRGGGGFGGRSRNEYGGPREFREPRHNY